MRTLTTIPAEASAFRPIGVRSGDMVAALALAALFLAIQVAIGLPALHVAGGDNDSLLRMVQVRDLLGGQGWFDLHQYRMGPQGGFVMHWSRLVDAPIAAIIVAAQALGATPGQAETAALVLWPLATLAGSLYFLLRAARAVGGAEAVFPAGIIGLAALYFVGIFAPGAIDHHNVQLMLTLAMASFLAAARRGAWTGAAAGACGALMLAIGMETVAYVAAGGAVVAGAFVSREAGRVAAGFGLAFAVVSAAAFLVTVPPADWTLVRCDAFSGAHLLVAAVAGLGLSAAAMAGGRTPVLRAGALLVLGAAVGVTVLAAAPQCLADPYAGLDPRLIRFWLGSVIEAQSFLSVLRSDKVMVASYYVTPLLGLGVLVWSARRGVSQAALTVGVLLFAAILVSLWQVRGAVFAIPFATIPLAAWIGGLRHAAQSGQPGALLRMALAWLVSINILWAGGSQAVEKMLPAHMRAAVVDATPLGKCYKDHDLDALAAEPAGTVLAISNLGAPILNRTTHRVLAGPYHRNVAGNLMVLDALMGGEADALRVVRDAGATLVVLCPGNGETAALTHWAPGGFLASLDKGTIPSWLAPMAATTEAPLRVFRVAPVRAAR